MDAFLAEILKAVVLLTSAFNFITLVFCYRREEGTHRKLAYSVAALFVAVGQLYNIFAALHNAPFDLPEVLSQIGLAVAIGLAFGSVKRAAMQMVLHHKL